MYVNLIKITSLTCSDMLRHGRTEETLYGSHASDPVLLSNEYGAQETMKEV